MKRERKHGNSTETLATQATFLAGEVKTPRGEVVARHGESKDVNFSSSEVVFHIFTGLKIQHRIEIFTNKYATNRHDPVHCAVLATVFVTMGKLPFLISCGSVLKHLDLD